MAFVFAFLQQRSLLMKLRLLLLSVLLVLGSVESFVSSSRIASSRPANINIHLSAPASASASALRLYPERDNLNDINNQPIGSLLLQTLTLSKSSVLSVVAAAAIFAGALTADLPDASAATATAPAPIPVEVLKLSKGAVVIQTSQRASESLLRSTVDSKSLLKTLLVNRKALLESLRRMRSAINTELGTQPVWKELQTELLSVEGDLASTVQFLPPSDWRETFKDISGGNLNLLVNGEVINVAVVPQFGEMEDKVMIEIKGYKGNNDDLIRFVNNQAATAAASSSKYGPIRSYFSRFERFWSWWGTPYLPQYLLPNMQATNGQIILTGTAGTIWLLYLSAYMYYDYEQKQGFKKAENKRAALIASAKQAKTVVLIHKKAEPSTEENTQQVKESANDGKVITNAVEASLPTTIVKASTSDVAEMKEEATPTKRRRRLGGILFWRGN